jgi:hypothetical protein
MGQMEKRLCRHPFHPLYPCFSSAFLRVLCGAIFAVEASHATHSRARPDKIMCPYEIGCKQGCALEFLVLIGAGVYFAWSWQTRAQPRLGEDFTKLTPAQKTSAAPKHSSWKGKCAIWRKQRSAMSASHFRFR